MKNKVIFITGTDGAGKSTLAKSLYNYISSNGKRSCIVWSRFHNYFSKPLLALARISGHNYYKTIDSIKFGFHDFERLPFFNFFFKFCQMIDVNIAAFIFITRVKFNFDVIVCERGPWDTLCDIMVDTGDKIHPQSLLGRLFLIQAKDATVFYIKRSEENIIKTRPELIHDYKLRTKVENYNFLSESSSWIEIDNNESLSAAEFALLKQFISGGINR